MYAKVKALELSGIIRSVNSEELSLFSIRMMDSISRKGCIFVCGNGGSGATANLVASDLMDRGIRSISLNANMTVINRISAEFGYDKVFSKQICHLGCRGDLLLALSGSGNSLNILEAVMKSKEMGIETLGLTGMEGGRLVHIADNSLVVHSNDMEQIENAHSILAHAVLTEIHNIEVIK